MIWEGLLNPFFNLIDVLIGLFPSVESTGSVSIGSQVFDMLKMGLYFTGTYWLVLSITTFTTWYSLILGWSVVEWVYKKIPGVS